MSRAISLQARISDVAFYHFNASTRYDDNFSIRLSRQLAELGDLDIKKISGAVARIKTSFFKINKVNRKEFADALYNDFNACELLKSPIELSKGDAVIRLALLDILEATSLKQAKTIVRRALRAIAN